jgi:hypothetical protein
MNVVNVTDASGASVQAKATQCVADDTHLTNQELLALFRAWRFAGADDVMSKRIHPSKQPAT